MCKKEQSRSMMGGSTTALDNVETPLIYGGAKERHRRAAGLNPIDALRYE